MSDPIISAYWAHGAAARVRHEKSSKSVTYSGRGLTVEDDLGSNEFVVPLPTPVHFDGKDAVLRFIRIRGEANDGATVQNVRLFYGRTELFNSGRLDLSRGLINQPFRMSNVTIQHGMTANITVKFRPGGRFELIGVGASYHRHFVSTHVIDSADEVPPDMEADEDDIVIENRPFPAPDWH